MRVYFKDEFYICFEMLQLQPKQKNTHIFYDYIVPTFIFMPYS